jgi:hypothetical protein
LAGGDETGVRRLHTSVCRKYGKNAAKKTGAWGNVH